MIMTIAQLVRDQSVKGVSGGYERCYNSLEARRCSRTTISRTKIKGVDQTCFHNAAIHINVPLARMPIVVVVSYKKAESAPDSCDPSQFDVPLLRCRSHRICVELASVLDELH